MSWSNLGGLLSGSPKLKTFSTLTPQQRGVSQKFGDYLSSRIGQPMEMYPGQMVAPMSQYEQQGMGYLGQYLGGQGTYMPQRQAAYAQALGGQMLSPIDMGASKQWFEQNVVPQYQQQFQRMSAPALEQAKGMGAGVSSSAMNRALAEQAGGMSQYLGDVGYQYMLQEQQAQRQREEQNAQYQLAAMGATEPGRAEQLSMIQASQQYGALPRMIEMQKLQADMQEWLRTRPEYSPVIGQAMQYLNTQMQGTYMQDQPGLMAKWSGAWNELGYAMSAPFQAFTMPGQSIQNLQSAWGGVGGGGVGGWIGQRMSGIAGGGGG